MANKVKFSVPEGEIEKKGVVFVRYSNGKKHGTIRIRQNHIDWLPADHEYVHEVTWAEFAALAESKPQSKKKLP